MNDEEILTINYWTIIWVVSFVPPRELPSLRCFTENPWFHRRLGQARWVWRRSDTSGCRSGLDHHRWTCSSSFFIQIRTNLLPNWLVPLHLLQCLLLSAWGFCNQIMIQLTAALAYWSFKVSAVADSGRLLVQEWHSLTSPTSCKLSFWSHSWTHK